MAYQPARTRRGFGRRPEKARPKTRTEKQRPSSEYLFVEEHVQTLEEAANNTLNSLRRLGSQRFALAPFHEHFDRWFRNLRITLSEFESNPSVKVDDQFTKECSQVLSDIDSVLKEKRLKEASLQESIRIVNQKILDLRVLLTRTEREFASKAKEITESKERAVKPIASRLGALGEELSRIVRMKTSLFSRVLKSGARKESEATQQLNSTKRELAAIEQSFAAEHGRLRDEYGRRREQLLDQIANHQREIKSLEASSQVDDALEVRRAACDALINVVNAFLRRTGLASETASFSL